MFCIVKFRVLVLDSLMYSHLSIGLLNQSLEGTLLLTDTIIFFFFFGFFILYMQKTGITVLSALRDQPMSLVGLNK